MTKRLKKQYSSIVAIEYNTLANAANCNVNFSRKHIKRKNAATHVQNSNNESFIIEWSSSDESDCCTSTSSVHEDSCISRLSRRNGIYRSCNSIPEQAHTYDDDQDVSFIEWSSSDEVKENLLDACESQKNRTTTNESRVEESTTKTALYLSMDCAPSRSKVQNKKLKSERSRPGGYLDQFNEKMRNIKASRKFLAFDKKYGLRNGQNLRVLKVDVSFGVPLATLLSPEDELVQIVLYDEYSENVKSGSMLESFMEETEPYEIEDCDGVNKIFLQPHKIIQT